MKKQLTSTLLLASMLASLASCGSDGDTTEQTTAAVGSDTTAEAVDTSVHDDLPADLNFGGEKFTILVSDYGGYTGADFYVEESNGDIVNDAIYERNRNVAERLNLDIEFPFYTYDWGVRNEYRNNVIASVMSGDGAYDIITDMGDTLASFVQHQIFTDMSKLKYLDITKPWWADKFMKASSVDGKYYMVTGDASLRLLKAMFCVFQNLDLSNNLKLSYSPYELVKKGEWTLDRFDLIIRDCYADLNGNAVTDKEDRFGLLLNHSNHYAGFFESLGMDMVEFADDEPKFIYGNEHNVDVIQRLCKLIHESEYVFCDPEGENETAFKSIFKEGNVMFATAWLMHTEALRDVSFDYGVLPYPKWDDSDDYGTTVLTNFSSFAIPIDSKDPDRAAAVLEALGAESYKILTPAYFEVALKVKYSRDDESAQMFDLIKNSIDFDFGYIYTDSMDRFADGKLKDRLAKNSPDWASFIAENQNALQAKLDTLVSTIRGE